MDQNYYIFAMFVTGLVCIIVVLCRLLFSDVKRQKKLLDEKESKLLKLYQSVEGIMEEFEDQAKAASEDILAFEQRAAKMAQQQKAALDAAKQELSNVKELQQDNSTHVLPSVAKRQPLSEAKPMTVDSTKFRATGGIYDRAERVVMGETAKTPGVGAKGMDSADGTGFHRVMEEASEALPDASEEPSKHKNIDEILALSKEGKNSAQIARILGITRNEVSLVIELGSVYV